MDWNSLHRLADSADQEDRCLSITRAIVQLEGFLTRAGINKKGCKEKLLEYALTWRDGRLDSALLAHLVLANRIRNRFQKAHKEIAEGKPDPRPKIATSRIHDAIRAVELLVNDAAGDARPHSPIDQSSPSETNSAGRPTSGGDWNKLRDLAISDSINDREKAIFSAVNHLDTILSRLKIEGKSRQDRLLALALRAQGPQSLDARLLAGLLRASDIRNTFAHDQEDAPPELSGTGNDDPRMSIPKDKIAAAISTIENLTVAVERIGTSSPSSHEFKRPVPQQAPTQQADTEAPPSSSSSEVPSVGSRVSSDQGVDTTTEAPQKRPGRMIWGPMALVALTGLVVTTATKYLGLGLLIGRQSCAPVFPPTDLGLPPQQPLQPVSKRLSFAAAREISGVGWPRTGAKGDLNRDGMTDLALADDDGVILLLGRGNGTFRSPRRFETPAGAETILVVDWDGDGKPDIMTGNYSAGSISVLPGLGNGSFKSAVNHVFGSGVKAIAVGDWNRDGILDATAACQRSGSILTRFGSGEGWLELRWHVIEMPGPQFMISGDLNHDRRPDLVVGVDDQAKPVRVLLGNKKGGFEDKSDAVGFSLDLAPSSFAMGDWNSDGKADIDGISGGNVAIALGQGDGSLFPSAVYAARGWPQHIVGADMNGDGKTDLVVTSSRSSAFEVLQGTADGRFEQSREFEVGHEIRSFVLSDWNGDKMPDIVALGTLPSTATIMLNTSE